ncbi:MAG: DUF4440 domain-containing protein [Oxalicibacterium faecigallinarum]|uniref:YybH family protein n=1 Tax=Oxalicibacterium faecigallinarum TaxID=573741 RepID=UPI0028096AA9|nr:nuclear transport factor 2 family protein [Oxalicibacterium faecigallinarum]MDQ7968323.1 DUF4440 domain-containing protein [Oxalicibacterium faecigallinarum]
MPADRAPDTRVARTPDDSSRILVAAIERGDIDTVVSLYEPDAILFSKSGRLMRGLDAIRENNLGLIALKPTFTIDFITATISADGTLATNRMKAELNWTDKDGNPKQASVDTLEVLRKQPDGSWLYVIDDPYGSMRAGMEKR